MGEHCVESDFICKAVNDMVGDIVAIGIIGAFVIIQIGGLRRRDKE
jgi:hypothetical protein